MNANSNFYFIIISFVFLFLAGIIMYRKAENKDDIDFSLSIIIISFIPGANMIITGVVFLLGLIVLFDKGFKKISNFLYNLKFKQ